MITAKEAWELGSEAREKRRQEKANATAKTIAEIEHVINTSAKDGFGYVGEWPLYGDVNVKEVKRHFADLGYALKEEPLGSYGNAIALTVLWEQPE